MTNADAYVIRIEQLATGEDSDVEDTYLKSFDPEAHPPGKRYPTGALVTTDDPLDAMHFDDAPSAIKFWKQEHGRRPDGEPNRPLTAFTVSIEPITIAQGREREGRDT